MDNSGAVNGRDFVFKRELSPIGRDRLRPIYSDGNVDLVDFSTLPLRYSEEAEDPDTNQVFRNVTNRRRGWDCAPIRGALGGLDGE